ncbi:cytochrome C [Gammaproteobacteria bacterium 53_120_T64]|nr:cytochrome C [Gammaproteobacteria bacterium 53_120_T64]
MAGWDIDVRPDGLGLPEGEGSVEDGELLYDAKCASCHGTFGEGEGRWPKLAGGMGTLNQQRPDKTVGSYWPYASTLWDYIRRAMPFPAPQSLAVDEVYAITAYVLNLNDLVNADFILNRESFKAIEMPNKDGFFVDDRPDVSNPRCWNNCIDLATIKWLEVIAGITPSVHIKEGGTDARAYREEAEAGGSEVDAVGKSIHDSACKICHGNGVAGAPITGDRDDWRERSQQDKALIYQHALEGFQGESGAMPAKGGRAQLDDSAVKAAVDYMLEKSR